jgi:hypothetical protein
MSTPLQDKIDALEAELREYTALPLADRLVPSTAALIAAKVTCLNKHLDAQAAAASSSSTATEARGKHLSPSFLYTVALI